MVNIILEANLIDQDAWYVWPGTTGPAWGSFDAFRAAPISRSRFPSADWQDAIGAAVRAAERAGIHTIFVARRE
jgi:hypothetical protein